MQTGSLHITHFHIAQSLKASHWNEFQYILNSKLSLGYGSVVENWQITKLVYKSNQKVYNVP